MDPKSLEGLTYTLGKPLTKEEFLALRANGDKSKVHTISPEGLEQLRSSMENMSLQETSTEDKRAKLRSKLLEMQGQRKRQTPNSPK